MVRFDSKFKNIKKKAVSFYCGKVGGRTPVVFLFVFLFFCAAPAWGEPVILAFGDSLTAGFGVRPDESYPSRLQVLIKEKGYAYKVVNAGVSGDTTAGGRRRIDWLLKHEPDIVILELGANDGLRGLPLEEMEKNLEAIIAACREKQARILLAGMKIPPNFGLDYTRGFEEVFFRLADKHDTGLIPFFLENVAAERDLTQPDGIHPVGAGYAVVVETVWKHLEPMLKEQSASRPGQESSSR